MICIKDKRSSLKHRYPLLPQYIPSAPMYYMYHSGHCFPLQFKLFKFQAWVVEHQVKKNLCDTYMVVRVS